MAKESVVNCHNTMTSRECIDCEIDAVGNCHLSKPEQPKDGILVPIFVPNQLIEHLPGREHGQCPEQPTTNAMIFEQANGSIKVTLELLEQLETKNTNEETQKNGCIWTLKGWHDNNLKHLQKAME